MDDEEWNLQRIESVYPRYQFDLRILKEKAKRLAQNALYYVSTAKTKKQLKENISPSDALKMLCVHRYYDHIIENFTKQQRTKHSIEVASGIFGNFIVSSIGLSAIGEMLSATFARV